MSSKQTTPKNTLKIADSGVQGKPGNSSSDELEVNLGDETGSDNGTKATEAKDTSEEKKSETKLDPAIAAIVEQNKILAQQNKELMDMVRNLVDGVKKPEKSEKSNNEEFDYLADILDTPVIFFSPLTDFIIHDEKIPNDNKKIVFKMIQRDYDKDTGKYNCLSGYMCTSKAVLQYLQKHPSNGIKFFNKTIQKGDLMYSDPELFDFVSSAMLQVNQLNQHDIIRECRQVGIEPTNDIAGMKKQLAYHIGKVKFDKTVNKTKAYSADNVKSGFEEMLSHS